MLLLAMLIVAIKYESNGADRVENHRNEGVSKKERGEKRMSMKPTYPNPA